MNDTVKSNNPYGEGITELIKREGEFRMLKKKLTAIIFAAVLSAGSTMVPAFAQDNSQSMQSGVMSGEKMKDDKMKDDKMSKPGKEQKRRKSRKHKSTKKMSDNKM